MKPPTRLSWLRSRDMSKPLGNVAHMEAGPLPDQASRRITCEATVAALLRERPCRLVSYRSAAVTSSALMLWEQRPGFWKDAVKRPG
jgi:hypothetical protein